MTNPTTTATQPVTTQPRNRTDRPVLAATDGTDITALRAAKLLAAEAHTGVAVVSAVEPALTLTYDVQGTFVPPDYEDELMEAREAELTRQVAAVGGARSTWPTSIRFGPAAEVIADEARQRDAALIVMNSGRHDRMTRLLTGETTLRTIRRAPVPVLAVVGELTAAPRVVVAAVDFSASSVSAARAALGIIAEQATLYLVHVWSRSPGSHPLERARDDAYERALPRLFDRVEEVLAAPRGITVRRVSVLGSPAEQLLQFAASQGADLIAAGRRGHGFFEQLLVGSVTTALVRASKCSVLVTPEPAPEEASVLARAVTGVFETSAPDEWAGQLDGFSRRNRGRRVALEVDDPHVGMQLQVTGVAFSGAVYDRNDRRIQIMLGEPADETQHLTHTIADVSAVAVRSAPGGRDEALRITHRGGYALLRFLPETRTATGAS